MSCVYLGWCSQSPPCLAVHWAGSEYVRPVLAAGPVLAQRRNPHSPPPSCCPGSPCSTPTSGQPASAAPAALEEEVGEGLDLCPSDASHSCGASSPPSHCASHCRRASSPAASPCWPWCHSREPHDPRRLFAARPGLHCAAAEGRNRQQRLRFRNPASGPPARSCGSRGCRRRWRSSARTPPCTAARWWSSCKVARLLHPGVCGRAWPGYWGPRPSNWGHWSSQLASKQGISWRRAPHPTPTHPSTSSPRQKERRKDKKDKNGKPASRHCLPPISIPMHPLFLLKIQHTSKVQLSKGQNFQDSFPYCLKTFIGNQNSTDWKRNCNCTSSGSSPVLFRTLIGSQLLKGFLHRCTTLRKYIFIWISRHKARCTWFFLAEMVKKKQ